jgi:hypothetical protein
MLVHDAYLRLVDVDRPQQWYGKGHFFRAEAEMGPGILRKLEPMTRNTVIGTSHES